MKFWNKLKYWQKGLRIGILFGFLLGVVMYLLMAKLSIIGFALLYPHISIFCTSNITPLCAFIVGTMGWLIFPIFYGIIGAIIGLIVEKVKNQKKVRSKRQA